MPHINLSKYSTRFYLIFLISLYLNGVYSRQYEVKKFNDDPGLSSAFIYSLAKDSFGYLWIGTAEGLIRFNGTSFRTFTIADSLPDNFVSCSFSDGRNMWFGHMNGSVSFYDRKSFKKVVLSSEESGPVTCINKDTEGSTWMSTYGGKLVNLSRHRESAEYKKLTEEQSVHSFLFISKDQLLIATSTGLNLCSISSADQIHVIKRIIENEPVVKILKNKAGNAYFAASSNGIYILNNDLTIRDTVTGIQDVQGISEDSFNTLWIATFTNGLLNYNISEQKFVSLKEFNGENIKTVFADDEGNIWIGGYGTGLSQMRNQIFNLLHFQKDIYGNSISAICHESESAWIATEKGLLQTNLKGRVIYFNSQLRNNISTLCDDGKENIWIGTKSDGLYILDRTHKLKKFDIHTGILEQSITSLAVSDDYMWAGTKKGLCRISLDNLQLKWFTISDGIPHNSINGLFKDNSGTIWISSRGSVLAYIKSDKVERLIIPSQSSSISFSEFTGEDETNLWAGTQGKGLYRISNDSLISLTTENGLYSDFCIDLIYDKRNHIWVVHKDGLSRIDTRNFFVRSYDSFMDQAKVTFNWNAASIDDQGKIWLGTETGILIIDQAGELAAIPSVPEILSVRVNNEQYYPEQGRIVLAPGKYSIEIEYFAVSLKEPDMVLYKVMLSGYDQQPELTKQTTAEYRNLSEGTFTFNLSVLNGDGITSDLGETLDIRIRTPLSKQWWFYLILVIASTSLTLAYIKRREFLHKQERKNLEKKVLERTREIQSQKDEIEQQRDLIRAKNAEITSSIRYALEIQNALFPSESKFEKYFPESFIFMRPKDIVSGDFYWMSRKNERLVFTVADCTGHGVPGAFMSLLSIARLNEIVNIEGITDSDKIVNRLQVLIHKSLHRTRDDGLDMALCVYDRTRMKIQFTGAMNDLIHFRNGEFSKIKANPYSVNMNREDDFTFTMNELDVHKGDIIYLYSDGYMDQFGGCKDKKFSARRFYNLLKEIHNMPMCGQKEFLERRLLEWKEDRIQTDDIIIMGIRF